MQEDCRCILPKRGDLIVYHESRSKTDSRKDGNFKYMNYGIPYKGSKSRIAPFIISKLPKSHTFVDLFAGGCAMTHAAMLSNKYDRFICNDISNAPQLFVDAANGKYRNEQRWISREDFYRLKDSDPYVRICWSFGNNQKDYLYAPEIERFKQLLHCVFFANTPKSARLAWRRFANEFAKVHKEIACLTQQLLQLCRECEVEPIFNKDNTIDTATTYHSCFKVMSSHLRNYLRTALTLSGLTQSDVNKYLGNQMSGHYFGESQWMLPTAEQYGKLQKILPALTKPYAELSQSLQRLQRLQSLERLESLQSLESLERLESLQSLESLERLQRLESLESLESLQRLQRLQIDYQAVQIPHGSTVYCDPPYLNTSGYLAEFDHERFYEWLRSRDFVVYISEYSMPQDFVCIAECPCRCSYAVTSSKKTIERLFVHERWAHVALATPKEQVLF